MKPILLQMDYQAIIKLKLQKRMKERLPSIHNGVLMIIMLFPLG
jgi:hypothetical protein